MELGLSGQMDKLNINMNKKGAAATSPGTTHNRSRHSLHKRQVSAGGRALP